MARLAERPAMPTDTMIAMTTLNVILPDFNFRGLSDLAVIVHVSRENWLAAIYEGRPLEVVLEYWRDWATSRLLLNLVEDMLREGVTIDIDF